MKLALAIALRHLLARKRQSIVSLLGIVLGVGFFLAIAALMQGSEQDFIRRLIDNTPHITVSDSFRNSRRQPVEILYDKGAVELRNVKPQTETRGIRGYKQTIEWLRAQGGLRAAASLSGQGILSFAGQDVGVSITGMIPREVRDVTTIQNYIIEGSVDDLASNRSGIIIGAELARRMSLGLSDTVSLASPTGQVRVFTIVGIFRTGRAEYDETQAFLDLKRAQALLDRPNRANRILIKLDDPHQAQAFAAALEQRIGYKSVSWQEASEDILSTLTIRNIIMYTVVSAVLVVAAFGIYNIISTTVMEKHRDIAILKSMGFQARDIQRIFVIQGSVLGLLGSLAGLPLGSALMFALMQVRLKPPGATEPIAMPMSWDWKPFAIAALFALASAVFAAFLPARKGARVEPVDILRGGVA